MVSLAREIIKTFAKMFFITDEYQLKENVSEILSFVNEHPRYNKLLEDVQNPSGQNIYTGSMTLHRLNKP